MKVLFVAAMSIALLGACVGDASARQYGDIGGIISDPVGLGTWQARVRYRVPGHVVSGMYYTWAYADISAQTQSDCEYQLQSWSSGGNTTVIDYCHFVPN